MDSLTFGAYLRILLGVLIIVAAIIDLRTFRLIREREQLRERVIDQKNIQYQALASQAAAALEALRLGTEGKPHSEFARWVVEEERRRPPN